MAVATLVAYTDDSAVSADQTVASGAAVTLVPIFPGKPGKVVVVFITADDNDVYHKTIWAPYRLEGPVDYRVKVRHAGCDVNT